MILGACFTVISAAGADLHYNFAAGQTNVFSVEMSVRGENGSEVTTGNVILVTKAISTDTATLVCRGNLRTENKRPMSRGMGGPMYYPGGMMQNTFLNNYEVMLDLQGNEIRDGGDHVMEVPVGKLVQSLFPPLPEKPDEGALTDRVAVLGDPFWLGPSDSFLALRQNGSPMYMNMNFMYPGSSGPAILSVTRRTSSQCKTNPAGMLELHREIKLESPVRLGDQPCLLATSTLESTIDFNAGCATSIEIQGDVNSQTETTSRHAKVTFKARLLTGEERETVLSPAPGEEYPGGPVTGPKLDEAGLAKLKADLESGDVNKIRVALSQLANGKIESPPPELADIVATLASNDDSNLRQYVAQYLQNHGTDSQAATLLKLLKDPDASTSAAAAKGLGRLKDKDAIAPLVELLGRGMRVNQYGQVDDYQYLPDIASALANIGPAVQKPVIGLLNDRSIETRRQACVILKQVGTKASLEPLQKLVADPNPQLSQAAADAIREINQRM
jgi:hypothetical protein